MPQRCLGWLLWAARSQAADGGGLASSEGGPRLTGQAELRYRPSWPTTLRRKRMPRPTTGRHSQRRERAWAAACGELASVVGSIPSSARMRVCPTRPTPWTRALSRSPEARPGPERSLRGHRQRASLPAKRWTEWSTTSSSPFARSRSLVERVPLYTTPSGSSNSWESAYSAGESAPPSVHVFSTLPVFSGCLSPGASRKRP